MDDFGKENTSISLLRESCFDVIKFDKSFLSGCTEDKRARGLLDSMLQMVKNLGIKTHVEGIERWEEEDLLKNTSVTGCRVLLCKTHARRYADKLFAKNISRACVFNSNKTGKAQINGGIVAVCSALEEFFYCLKDTL